MQSPHAEWALGIGYLAVVDILRDRGEPDGDTLSECLRGIVAQVPAGRHLFAAGLTISAVGFYRHIVGPLGK